MRRFIFASVAVLVLSTAASLPTASVLQAEPALTIYNQNFAVVRDYATLDLKKGVNKVDFVGITAHLEPDSVILRDPAGKRRLQILEQNYRADPISQALLLSLYEGKEIEFQVGNERVKGKVIRSGYVPHQRAWQTYGQEYYMRQAAYVQGASGQPVIEVNGLLQFNLPGNPLFPALTEDSILKPTLNWLIETDEDGKVDAEICYVTGGMRWEASYNIVCPEKGDVMDLVGWVTMDNQSGKQFDEAKIKLMAGDVSKLRRNEGQDYMARAQFLSGVAGEMTPVVSEKAFDEYHLYDLNRRTTLHDRETKQVEFVRAENVKSERIYVYDGLYLDPRRYQGWDYENIRNNREYGAQSNPKVWVMREFKNSEDNNLGIPLPKGRTRFYRRDDDGQLEFTGENIIDHTPKDETVRVYTGNAFDLVGQRRQTDYQINTGQRWLDESFEIKVRNHKKEAVEVRVVEHLYRWVNWEIAKESREHIKTDTRTMEFRVKLEPDQEETITYKVHYSW
ncbi:MAG TPA: hypothetical protein PL033_20340 [Candidatus Brocadiia bacterium]|nr:hypothetical protein [Candidatus Brocadiia bacterium]